MLSTGSTFRAAGGLRTLRAMYALHPRRLALLLPLLAACGIANGIACGTARAVPRPDGPPAPPLLELVETAPIETTLEHADIPDAYQVWPALIGAAQKTLDIGEFYVISEPGKRMAPVLDAIAAAAKRGIKIRILADAKFAKQYHDDLDRLATLENTRVVQWDVGKTLGGVLHAKYFIVDGKEGYIGSQNFDWRSLEHIQELGVRIRIPEVVGFMSEVFDADWGTATGEPADKRAAHIGADSFPAHVQLGGEPALVTAVASPTKWLPDEALWNLSRLVALIDDAKQTVRVQLLTYETTHRGHEAFTTLDDALRRAAGRGVAVQLMVSNWDLRADHIGALASLAAVAGVEVRFVVIPEASTGFIPFARVCHTKLMVVDGQRSWVGTSNWGRNYFYTTRNVGIIVDNRPFAAQLDRFFLGTWDSAYAETFVPGRHYEAPRVSE